MVIEPEPYLGEFTTTADQVELSHKGHVRNRALTYADDRVVIGHYTMICSNENTLSQGLESKEGVGVEL
ncbi:hypothetical protein CEXT_151731 [Caerostris extrusa]|uniref:Uncharacterized protein n=1 Tax=Caerostris extrusa TaxID=172846 RepID=A0AAV4UUA7_CAEEX|nr:hypothetical protein CEXT_151731 [Caerostris extrusa]